MKTPQEIAAEVRVALDTLNYYEGTQRRDAIIGTALVAAREEGRREGIEQAADVVWGYKTDAEKGFLPSHSEWLHAANLKIRALASQPKPEPAVTGVSVPILPIDRAADEELERVINKAAVTPEQFAQSMNVSAKLEVSGALAGRNRGSAVTCDGCKAGLPRLHGEHFALCTDPHDERYDDTIYTPCTAKPEGGKEPGT